MVTAAAAEVTAAAAATAAATGAAAAGEVVRLGAVVCAAYAPAVCRAAAASWASLPLRP